MSRPPAQELGSERFERWAKAVWPYAIGIFGMALILIDVIILPPPGPNTLTSGIGLGLITGQGVVGLELHRRKVRDE